MKVKPNDLHKIIKYPSQLDISFTEQCNQDCDYCWADKSAKTRLDYNAIKKAIDIFCGLPLREKTVTFTTNEPLLDAALYKKTVNYLLSKRNPDNSIRIITTTNGILLTKPVRDFIVERLNDNFWLNISLDGLRQSHDAHRKLRGKPGISAFDISWKHFSRLPRDKVRVISTITPSEIGSFRQNMDFILDSGFRNLDVFAQMYTLWSEPDLAALERGLRYLVARFNKNPEERNNLRLLNRLWGDTHYAKVLFGSDAKFYLFEWVLAIPYLRRRKFIIGDILSGIDFDKRIALFDELFYSASKYNSPMPCKGCEYNTFCSYPLPLFLWCTYQKRDFSRYFMNFCSIAKIFIRFSLEVAPPVKNESDSIKLNKYLNATAKRAC